MLAQELLGSPGRGLRLLVAGGKLVGAAERVAAPGEWRTNVSVGGSLERAVPSPKASELGLGAAAALGTDLVGIDLLPAKGGYVVLELNAAVDFSDVYSLPGRDVYADIVSALELDLRKDACPADDVLTAERSR